MSLTSIIGIGGALVGGLISNRSAKSAARSQQRQEEEANRKWKEATLANASDQKDWDKKIAQDTYDASVRAMDVEYEGALDGLRLEGRALSSLRNHTANSYGQQIRHSVDMANLEVDNAIRTMTEQATLAVQTNVAAYNARRTAIADQLELTDQEARLQANIAAGEAEERKSDIALEADRASATARVAAGERGAAGTSMYTRMVAAGGALEGREMARVDGDLEDEFSVIEHGLVIAATNARADLVQADIQFLEGQGAVANEMSATMREVNTYMMGVGQDIENLTVQRAFELEAIDLEGEGLNQQQGQLDTLRALELDMLDDELETANDFADFIYNQTERATEANASASDALAASRASSATRMANTSFFTSVLSAGVDVLGDYAAHSVNTNRDRSRLSTGGGLAF